MRVASETPGSIGRVWPFSLDGNVLEYFVARCPAASSDRACSRPCATRNRPSTVSMPTRAGSEWAVCGTRKAGLEHAVEARVLVAPQPAP